MELGHEVHVLTTGKDGWAAEINDHGVAVHHLQCDPVSYTDQFADEILDSIKRIKPDIVHTDSFDNTRHWWKEIKECRAVTLHGFCWGAYLTTINVAIRQGNPLGLENPFNVPQAMKERECLLGFNTVIGISLHEQWMLQQLMGLEKVRLVYNPLPNYFFGNTKPPPTSGNRRFLCVAVSGQDIRGFKYAERAAKRAGYELEVVRNHARRDIPAILDRCHGLVLPTAYAQGLDLAVGEAIVRGRKVIATATGSYLREAQLGGLYQGAIRLVPLVDPVAAIVEAMQSTDLYPTDASEPARYLHRPEVHAQKWLEAILE